MDLTRAIAVWLVIIGATGCSRFEHRERLALSTNFTKMATGKTTVEEITSSNQVRQYRLHVLGKDSPGRPVPLVVNLHS